MSDDILPAHILGHGCTLRQSGVDQCTTTNIAIIGRYMTNGLSSRESRNAPHTNSSRR